MTWQDPPQRGEVWCGKSASGGRETRTVIDRFMGGDVSYATGRVTRSQWTGRGTGLLRCTEAEWLEWQKRATRTE